MEGNYIPEMVYKDSKSLKKMKNLNFPYNRIGRVVIFDEYGKEIAHGTGINCIGSFVITSLHIFVKMRKSRNPELEF